MVIFSSFINNGAMIMVNKGIVLFKIEATADGIRVSAQDIKTNGTTTLNIPSSRKVHHFLRPGNPDRR